MTAVSDETAEHLRTILEALYPPAAAASAHERLLERMRDVRVPPRDPHLFDESDVVLITYPDQVREDGVAPLETLREVLVQRVGTGINGLHLLPHYPWTSDDGFAVVDPREVEPTYGSWADVERLAGDFRLMIDAVVNHVSSANPWFRGWCEGDPHYRDFFIAVDPATDLSAVTRPRATPLLTPVETVDGVRHVWSTFGPDQIDLNYADPEVLLTVTDVLLGYVEHGASMLRLDAVAYLWKRPGTSCIHLEETHQIVRLWRTVLDAVAPGTLIITETNVPHEENVSYFGAGDDEAHLVYQFPLPPLVLAAFHAGDASVLQRWVATLRTPSPETTFLNFLASHDGIGVRPAEGILSAEEIERLCAGAVAQGGGVSHKRNPDGSESPYEINAALFDALLPPEVDEPGDVDVDRFLAAHAIMLVLAGVPGLYVNALLGGRNWTEGVERTGRLRTINRRKYERTELDAELEDPASLRRRVLTGLLDLVAARTGEPAFHPGAAQRVLPTPPALLALERTVDERQVICAHDVSGRAQTFTTEATGRFVDLLDGSVREADGQLSVPLAPYGVRWLRREPPT